jgi:hypothetical protein
MVSPWRPAKDRYGEMYGRAGRDGCFRGKLGSGGMLMITKEHITIGLRKNGDSYPKV